MESQLACATGGGSATFATNQVTLPIDCVSWYTAYAFCIWDGGRLPTEAEWNYAAAGGSDQRYYPWSSPASSTSLDATRAVYLDDSGGQVQSVGSVPAGNGRWGHADLAGNVFEWTLDYSNSLQTPCVDCLNPVLGLSRSVRGGGFKTPVAGLPTFARSDLMPDSLTTTVGFRCVHDL